MSAAAAATATGAVVAAAAQQRNNAVRAKLSEALRVSQLKGAPRMPARGPTPAGQTGAAKRAHGEKSIPVASVIARYAFTSPDPKSHAAKLTRLAALSFAGGLAERSAMAAPAASVELTPALAEAIGGPAGVAAVATEMQEFAAASITGGFTWLVVRGDRIEQAAAAASAVDEATGSAKPLAEHASASPIVEVLNTPAHVSPLMLGYFPLACIDMTPEAYLVAPANASSSSAESAAAATAASRVPQPPSWSRAARNKQVSFTPPAALTLDTAESHIAPSVRRATHAAQSAARLDWAFIGEQFEKARVWYLGERRQVKRAARKSGLTAGAVSRLPRRSAAADVEDEAPVTSSAEPTATTGAAGTAEAETATTTTTSAESTDVIPPVDPAVTAEATTAAADEAAAESAAEAAHAAESAMAMNPSGPRPMPEGNGEQLDDGSVAFTFPDGSQEFIRADGTRSVIRVDGQQEEYTANGVLHFYVKANGTQVWPSHEEGQDLLRTLVEADGTTVYEYRTGASITKYPNGDTKTVYSDGQEVIEKAPAE